MSDPTDVNQSQPDAADDRTGTRRSRRAMRQAERAAEREAILTGQQPLLTRRELKRLRQEAAALRAAVASGEITPEQARALQDPLAEQPMIGSPSLEAAGSHAAPSGPSGTGAGEPAVPGSAFRGEGLLDASGRLAPSGPVAPASYDEAEAARVLQSPGRPLTSGASGAGGPDGATALPGARMVGGEPGASPVSPATSSAPHSEEGGADTWRARPYAPEPAMRTSAPSAPSPVGEAAFGQGTAPGGPGGEAAPFTSGTGPGTERTFTEPAPQVANASLSDDDIEDISAQPTGVMNAVETSALSPLPSASRTDEPAGLPERRSLFNRDASADSRTGDSAPAPSGADGYGSGGPAPAPSGADGYGSGGPAPAPSGTDGYGVPGSADAGGLPEWATQPAAGGPPRRPTVRIPNAAQGVRTVDTSTGELSEVRPIDDEFDGIDNPQWRILRPEGAQPDVPGAPEAAVEEPAPAPAPGPAFTPYESMPEPAAPEPQLSGPAAAAPADSEASWSAPGPATSPMRPVAEPPKTSKMGKILLIALLVAVVALVVLAVVWFFLNREGASSAGAFDSISAWTPLLDC
ncbi:hypothetical protein [Actinomyces israelii]|uniref:hypothetical protein n=1 Tax=Actinomyces israelii TaxID=1659 RepID=UPI0005BADA8F|nr:hypothetical protein [Actinomyces israelii]